MDHDPNEELHYETTQALMHAKELGLPENDLLLLCWHSGINYEKEIKDASVHPER